MFQRQRCANTQHQSANGGDQQVDYEPRAGGFGGDIGRINNRDIVNACPAGHANFFEALEQAIIKGLIGIHLLLVDIILDGAAALIEEFPFQLSDFSAQRIFARGGLTELCLDRAGNAALLAAD